MSMSSDIRGLVMTMGLLTRVMTTWLWTQIDWVGTGAAWPVGPGRTLAAGLWPLALSGPCPPSEASQPGPDSGPESSKELWAVRDLGWGARQWPGSVSVYLSRLGEPRSSQASEARTHSQLTEINSDPGPDPHQGPGASHPMIVWPHVCLAVWAPCPSACTWCHSCVPCAQCPGKSRMWRMRQKWSTKVWIKTRHDSPPSSRYHSFLRARLECELCIVVLKWGGGSIGTKRAGGLKCFIFLKWDIKLVKVKYWPAIKSEKFGDTIFHHFFMSI